MTAVAAFTDTQLPDLNPTLRDPAQIAYPISLPIELALRTNTTAKICEAYHISREEWDQLRVHPMFVADLKTAVELVKKDGMSFKLKARMQAEEYLKKIWQMVHAPTDEVPATVRADLMKFTIRAGGLDESVGQAQAAKSAMGSLLQININLG